MSVRHLVRLLVVPMALVSLAGPVADGAAAAAAPPDSQVAPAIFVRPADGLLSGQQVRVRGRGFTPGATIIVVECVSNADRSGNCDARASRSVTASATGSFAVDLTVHNHIFTATHEHTFCDVAPGTCAVVATKDKDLVESAQVPISFNP